MKKNWKETYWHKKPKVKSQTFVFVDFIIPEQNMMQGLFDSMFPAMEEQNVTVTEIRDGWNWTLKHYWVFSLGSINTTVAGGKISGQGSKKYEHVIKEAIKKFQLNGVDESKSVVYFGEYLTKPAVMYDITDNHVFQLGDVEDVLLNYKTKNYLSRDGRDKVHVHENVRVIRLPINQSVISDIFNWGSEGLFRYLNSDSYVNIPLEQAEFSKVVELKPKIE